MPRFPLFFLLCLAAPALAEESMPPLLAEGEAVTSVETLLANITPRHEILALAYSPDGRTLAVGSYNRDIQLWDMPAGLERLRLVGHSGGVTALAFSPDGRWLLSGGGDHSARLWDAGSGAEIRRLEDHQGVVKTVAFSPNGTWAASAGADQAVRLYRLDAPNLPAQILHHSNAVNGMAFGADGKTLATATANGVFLWDIATAKVLLNLNPPGGTIEALAFSPDGRTLAGSGGDNLTRLWEIASGREIRRFSGHTARPMALAFSPDGHTLASAAEDRTARLWDVASGQETRRLSGHSGAINALAFGAQGTLLAGGGQDHQVLLWDAQSGLEVSRLEGHLSPVVAVAAHPGGRWLAVGSADNAARLWDRQENRELARLDGHAATITAVQFSPDGKILASASADKTIQLWSIPSGEHLRRLDGHLDGVRALAFSPSGTMLASASYDRSVRLWNVDDGTEIRRLQELREEVLALAFSPDGGVLAAGSNNQMIGLWDMRSQTLIRRMQGHNQGIYALAFSPDGKLLASAGNDGQTWLWDMENNAPERQFSGPGRPINALAFSRDGRWLAANSGGDGDIRRWDVASGVETRRLQGHQGFVLSLAVTPDNRLVSGSSDGTARLWQFEDGGWEQVFVSGSRKTWLSCRLAEPRCWRYDDGTLLLSQDHDRRLHPLPLPAQTAGRLQISPLPPLLQIPTGESKRFRLLVYNLGSSPVYWLRLQLADTANPRLVFYPPPVTARLEPGESRAMDVTVSAWSEYQQPQEALVRLDLSLRSANAPTLEISQPAQILTPRLRLQKIVLLQTEQARPALVATLQNQGGQNLSGVEFSAQIDGLPALDKVTRASIASGETVSLSFALPEIPLFERQLEARLSARRLEPPIQIWQFEPQAVELPPSAWPWGAAFLLLLVGGVAVYGLRLYYHPLVVELSARPTALLALPLPQLARASNLLRRARRFETVLAASQIQPDTFYQAVRYARQPPRQQTALLAARLGAQWETVPPAEPVEVGGDRRSAPFDKLRERQPPPLPEPVEGRDAVNGGDLFVLRLHESFPLNLQSCLLYFPPPGQGLAETLNELRHREALVMEKVVIMSHDQGLQLALRPYGEDPATLWIVPNSSELSGWLLSPDPVALFAQTLARQLKVTQISPYQTRSGVNKDTVFFGRAQILAEILHREPANYLVVGGRQLGKSSLLKHLYRRYQDQPGIRCHYLTLHDGNLLGRLAVEVGLPTTSTADSVCERLAGLPQRRLLLVDEADLFVRAEAAAQYRLLNQFRALSEEGRCHFIFAGFWDLYRASVLEYQSPLKNFGEPITVGALEPEACRELATKPMRSMSLRYESDALVDELLAATGQRANLIAIACNEMLKSLVMQERVFHQRHLHQALRSSALRDAIAGWENLTDNPADNRLDRIVVYATAHTGSFSHAELLRLLDGYGYACNLEQLKQSLARLTLSFVIRREDDGQYGYCVPLFRDLLLEDSVEDLLARELAG